MSPTLRVLCVLNHKQDNSDAQYRGFRSNFLLLTIVANAYLFVKYLWVNMASPPENNLHLIRYNLVWSMLVLIGLHGKGLLKILIILTINFFIARFSRRSKARPVLTWVFNGAVLFANDKYNGYHFGEILPSLAILVCV